MLIRKRGPTQPIGSHLMKPLCVCLSLHVWCRSVPCKATELEEVPFLCTLYPTFKTNTKCKISIRWRTLNMDVPTRCKCFVKCFMKSSYTTANNSPFYFVLLHSYTKSNCHIYNDLKSRKLTLVRVQRSICGIRLGGRDVVGRGTGWGGSGRWGEGCVCAVTLRYTAVAVLGDWSTVSIWNLKELFRQETVVYIVQVKVSHNNTKLY